MFGFFSINFIAQTDVDRILKVGDIIVNGMTLLKKDKTQEKIENTKEIESICILNKMENKITFTMMRTDEIGIAVKKELVLQQGGKECVYNIPKGIYSYKIVLANNEVFRQGEYKFDDEVTIIVKQDK